MRAEADRILGARLAGAARRHARHRPLTGAEIAAGAAELRSRAGDRPGLLAEQAGLELGCHSLADGDWTYHRIAADLLVAAGAGPPEEIARWAADSAGCLPVLHRPGGAFVFSRARIPGPGAGRSQGPGRPVRR